MISADLPKGRFFLFFNCNFRLAWQVSEGTFLKKLPIMKKLSLVILVSLMSFIGHSQLGNKSMFYSLDRSHSDMSFSVKWMSRGRVVGTFNNVNGTIYYNPQKPRDLSASLTIDIRSLNTANIFRDNTLKRDWFDTANHKFAYFESLPLTPQDKPGKIRGRFTLKGITKIITLSLEKIDPPARDYEDNPFVVISGKTTISRKAFNVGMATSRYETSQTSAIAIPDSVTIEFNLYGRQNGLKFSILRLGNPSSRASQLYNLTKDASKDRIVRVIDSMYTDPKVRDEDISVWTVGNHYITTNDLVRSIIFLEKTLEIFPENINTYESIMQHYYQTGEKDKVKIYIDKILKQNPHNPSALEYQRRLQ